MADIDTTSPEYKEAYERHYQLRRAQDHNSTNAHYLAESDAERELREKAERTAEPTYDPATEAGQWCWWRHTGQPAHRIVQGKGRALCGAIVLGAAYVAPASVEGGTGGDTCQLCKARHESIVLRAQLARVIDAAKTYRDRKTHRMASEVYCPERKALDVVLAEVDRG